MLSTEANDRLTRIGSGTPMGELFRRYWLPIRPIAQLLEEPVIPVRILGENLVLFRTLEGASGLVGERCPHRMTQLKYGYPDGPGLRCCYHGWMFSPSGQCLDTPLEPPDSSLKGRIKIQSYPVREMGGLVWAYMGPEPIPLLPRWDLFVVSNAIRQIGVMKLPCNWLQAQENTGDPAHSAILHGSYYRYILSKQGELPTEALEARMKLAQGIESLWVEPTSYGARKGIKYSRALGAQNDYLSEHSTAVFPFFTQTGGPGQVRQEIQIRVPVDDTNTYHINYGCFLALNGVTAPEQPVIPWYEVPLYHEDGTPVLDCVLCQDAHAWLAQGPVTDRTREHLGRTDAPIVFLRKQFEEQLKVLEAGRDPMNVFRDPNSMPDVLHGGKWAVTTEPKAIDSESAAATSAYNRGYNLYEDANRYGPAMPQIIEMMKAIEAFRPGS
jgi:Phenylpropionate dioxygenase and related ring-hydroxylating dioxygenases, large terminal subunit